MFDRWAELLKLINQIIKKLDELEYRIERIEGGTK